MSERSDVHGLRRQFEVLYGGLLRSLESGEDLACSYHGELSDFTRLNGNRVRQTGHVQQQNLRLQLLRGQTHAALTLNITGDEGLDRGRCAEALKRLRADLEVLPEDPHLLLNREPQEHVDIVESTLPSSADSLEALMDFAQGEDLVGIWASGPVCTGFASTLGQRFFHARSCFNLDFSLYSGGDKAVKSDYAGMEFDEGALRRKVDLARRQLPALSRPAKTLKPGAYRAWLSPAALAEVVGMVAWDSFGLKSQRTRQSGIQRLVDGLERWSPLVTMEEELSGGVSPKFGASGFIRPTSTPLVTAGAYAGALVSPRSAKEYGGVTTGGAEAPTSLWMHPGQLEDDDALTSLGTGVYVGNLWYTNWSDRPAGRLTGMTRFATFWVEGGEVVAPLSVMRFDDTLEHMLGRHLEALGSRSDLQLSNSTYERRSTASVRLPSALLSSLQLTL